VRWGFAPFGVDLRGWNIFGDAPPQAHARNFALLGPMSKEIARLNFEGKLKTAMQETGQTQQELDFGAWQATIAYGYPQRDGRRAREPVTHTEPLWSRSAGPMSSWLPVWTPASTFIFTAGLPGMRMQILSAQEGTFENGAGLGRPSMGHLLLDSLTARHLATAATEAAS